MLVFVAFCKFKSRESVNCERMQAYLLGEEVQEDVHVATHGCHMQVSVVLWFFLVAVGSPVHKLLYAFVCSVKYS